MTSRDRVLWFIRNCGYSPTVRDIGRAVGLKSPSSVQKHLAALEHDGQIRRLGEARRIAPAPKDAA